MHLDYRNMCMLIAILGKENFCFELVSESMEHAVEYLVGHFTTSRKVPGSIPDEVNRPNPSSSTYPLVRLSL
jgi:hypothetical protein